MLLLMPNAQSSSPVSVTAEFDEVATGERAPGPLQAATRRETAEFEPSGNLHQAITGRASRIARLSAVLGRWWRGSEGVGVHEAPTGPVPPRTRSPGR